MNNGTRLVPVTVDDGPELIKANLENQDFHRLWADPFTDEVGFQSWFNRLNSGANVSLLIRAAEDDGLVGVINLTEIVRGEFQSAHLGFYGMEQYCGRGLMTAALQAVLAYAFTELGLHRLEANIRPGNQRSIALVKRAGFRCEGYSPKFLFLDGQWRDHERWAITKEDTNLPRSGDVRS